MKGTPRDQGALDVSILSQGTNRARRGTRPGHSTTAMISSQPSYRLDNCRCARRSKDSGE
jgi:hypothetical protein